MKTLTWVATLLLFAAASYGQKDERITVKAGSDVEQSLAREIFQYPAFVPGTVHYKDGRVSSTSLNYNRLLGEFQFINSSNDTFVIADPQLIKTVVADKDTFYFSEGFVRELRSAPRVKLGLKETLKVISREKIGAYGMASPNSSISSLSSYDDGRRMYQLAVRQDIIFAKRRTYYFGDAYNNFFPASRKRLLGLDPNHSTEIENYLRDNKVDFHDGSDLAQLVEFIAGLK
jgi:hypothetical protein